MTRPISLPIDDIPAWLAQKAAGARVVVPGGPLEPTTLADAFAQQPHHAANLIFCGMMLPGINTTDWAAFHPDARAEIFLPSPDRAATIATGQTRVLPLHYSASYRYLRDASVSVAIFHVTPPDQNGLCNLSLSADITPAFIDRDVLKIGIINPALPVILGAPKVALSMFDVISEHESPALTVEAHATGLDASAIANHVAGLVDNGATLQAGIGKLPGAVMSALSGHKDLRLHSGLIGDWAMALTSAGALVDDADSLVAGVVLGTTALHTALEADSRLSLRPISQTHDHKIIAATPSFTSINAALEIDLYGQINCEFAGARTLAGVGGSVDFLRGARASDGGKPIIMIQSQGKGGVSRILPRLEAPCVSIARSDPPILVTEQGWVDLEPLDTQARARAIIKLAHPTHHEALSNAWKAMPQ